MPKALMAKSSKGKGTEQSQKHSAEVDRQPISASPGAAVLALQRSAGNHAVNHSLVQGLGTLPSTSGLLQRKCACGNNTMAGGKCEECGKKQRLGLQTKLKVNEPGDVYEQEADRIADQVMAKPTHSAVRAAPLSIQRFSGQSNGQMNAAPASVNQAIASPGKPLEPALRQDMEQRFGHDFSLVRVHTGAAAEQSAQDVNAHAYTVGHSIVFGAGRFAPGTHEGRRLIAHELTHVRQQSTGQIAGMVQREPNKDDWSDFESIFSGEPRFVFWAKRRGKRPANYGEITALLDEYNRVKDTKDVLEEYDRAQLEKDRSELEKRRQAARAAEDRAGKGIDKAARTAQIKKLAAARPMNPLEDFEPGIHDYAPYPGQPQSVDADIVGGDFDAEDLTIKYSDGKELDIPLGGNLLFPNKPLDPQKVLRIFTRRHKKSQRLIPFVIYENTLGADLDVLSEEELALMGLPRFDPLLTPVIMYFLSPEFKLQKLSLATLKIASLHAMGLGLRQLGAPLATSTVRTGTALVTGAARTGGALVTAAARHVSIAVNTSASVGEAATYLGRTAYTFYLANAYTINTIGIVGTDIAVNLGGGDTGGISPGDEVSMVVADAKAAARGIKEWKLIEGEVHEVNLASKEVKLGVAKVADIAENAAKEYGPGTKMAVLLEPAGKGKVKLPPDPRPKLDIDELSRINKQLETQLPKLSKKYAPAALKKLSNLSAEQIKEAQIHPSDLEKLYKKLASAGDTTQQFINSFHDAPNFEQVVLNWAKSQGWSKKWNFKTKEWEWAWKETKIMRSGANFLMKYCVANLKGKKVRFEWPMGIKDTSWGEEVWARYVDVVVEDGSDVKPGQSIFVELKSWTERTLRLKTPSKTGVQFQLTRDTALLGPDRIRWVFDGKKVTKDAVMDAFLAIIRSDDYLRSKWGKDDKAIKEALDRVIEVFK